MLALQAETDIELAKSAMETELKILEGLLNLKPDDRELLELATQGFSGYAMMFVEDRDPERAMKLYRRARDYGLRALNKRHSGISRERIPLNELDQIIRKFTRKDIPIVYWTAVAWGAQINLQRTSPKALAEFPRAISLMKWVLEKDQGFYYSGPLWFFGSYYASIPPLIGGDIKKSQDYFQRALENDGNNFLWGKLLFARHYAVQALDRNSFETALTQIINASPCDLPEELRLLNTIAQIRAHELLKKMDDYF